METPGAPSSVQVGLNSKLSNMVTPNQGPFGLFSNSGSGSLPGQLSGPRGIAASDETGQIYVVDMGNARVEQYSADGTFIAAFGGTADTDRIVDSHRPGPRPTGVAIGPDGLVYVCDTWAHRILVLDRKGLRRARVGQFRQSQ